MGRGTRAPVRLLHVTTVPESLIFLRGQVGFMKAHGMEVEVLSSPGPELEQFAASQGVRAHAVAMPRRITPLQDLRALLALTRVIRSAAPRIVHAHTPKGGLLGMLGATLAGVPVRVYHMRGLPVETASGVRRMLLTATEWISCRLAHRVICVSHSLRTAAVERGICSPVKMSVLAGGSGNGVDAEGRFDPARISREQAMRVRERHGIPGDAFVVGFVGRIVRDKGIPELEAAWRRLRDRFPGLHLLVVGKFEPQDPVPDQVAASLSGDPRIHLVPMTWDIAPIYAAMDLLVLPTYREGFPNVLLEAAAMERPVVATAVTGCVDAVSDGLTGTLVPLGDVRALADALAGYVSDPDRCLAVGERARARVLRDFRPERIWTELRDEYQRLLAEAGDTTFAPNELAAGSPALVVETSLQGNPPSPVK